MSEEEIEEEFILPWKLEKDIRIEFVKKAKFKGERTDRTAWVKVTGPKALVEQLEFFEYRQGEYFHIGVSNFRVKDMVLPNDGRVKDYTRPEGVQSLMKWMEKDAKKD